MTTPTAAGAPRPSFSPVPNTPGADPQRPRVALIMVVATPYWLHLHRRIDREIPEIELHCLYTHDIPDQPWALDGAADIRPVRFGAGERAEGKAIFGSAKREYARAGRIIRWLKENNARFVVLYGYNDAGRIRILRWCKRVGIPCFIAADSNIKDDHARGVKAILKKILVGSAVRSATGGMPFGTAGKNYFVKYGAKPNNVYLVPGEPDYTIIDAVTDSAVAAVAQRFGLQMDEPRRRRLVFCGRLVHVKGIDTLVDAFCQIATSRTDWDLVVVGDGALKTELQQRVPATLKDRVIWTGFVGDPSTIAALYKACDVLVLPSRFEPWGLVVNEALAAGAALVASDIVGAADDLLRPGVNGLSFPAGDTSALAAALMDVTDPSKIDAYKAGSARVIADWRRTADPVQGLRAALVATGILPRV